MGNFASKLNEGEKISPETPPPVVETPKRPKVLPFDPRSPSDYISRTPITVVNDGQSGKTFTPITEKIKVLPTDPRSPTNEILRTPIEVESKIKPRHLPNRLSKLATISSDFNNEECDPRSPTEKVPRTPLEDNTYDPKNNYNEKTKPTKDLENLDKLSEQKEFVKENCNGLSNTQDSSKISNRIPLVDIQNLSTKDSSSLPQSKCEAVEEEFTKVEQNLITQLSTTDTVPTSTEFIENI